ncbi:MAG: hypothetical protein ACLFSU_06235, partial [Acholeplasmataceae bacterium]
KSPLKLKDGYRWNVLLGDDVNERMIQDYAANVHPVSEEAMRFKDTFLEALHVVSEQDAEDFIESFVRALETARTTSLGRSIGSGSAIETLKGSKKRIMALFNGDFVLVGYRKDIYEHPF